MAYTKNPQWKDYPDESTPVTAERLNHLEDGVYAAAATADSAAAGLSGKADTGHTHTAGDVSGLATVATSGSYDDLDDKPSIPSTPGDIGAAAASHQHAAGDITSGTIAPARLGSGTADDTKFLRGDGTWQAPPTGGGGVPLVASTAVGKWFTYPLFMSFDENVYIRANKDMPLIVAEAMSIDAVTMTVGTAPSEATVAVINLLDASRTFVQKVCDLPVPTATGDVTAVFTPLALSPGVYHLEVVGVAYGQPGNFGAKFTCGKVIGWDAGQGLSAPNTQAATFPRRLASEVFAPVTPMIWARRSA